MVYNIAEIKYTSCYPVICNLVPKRQTLCTQARAIQSKFLKISKMAFLFICLLLLYLCLQQFNKSTTLKPKTEKLCSLLFLSSKSKQLCLAFFFVSKTEHLCSLVFLSSKSKQLCLAFFFVPKTEQLCSLMFLSSKTKQLSLAFFFVPKTEQLCSL